MTDYEPDRDRVQDRAEDRSRRRANQAESTLRELDSQLEAADITYPVRGEELATEYGITAIDLPNETESMGSVFDRLGTEEFADATAVREAVAGEIADSTSVAGDQPTVDAGETGPGVGDERERGTVDEAAVDQAIESHADRTEEPDPTESTAEDPEDR